MRISFAFVAIALFALVGLAVADFDAPLFQFAEEARFDSLDFHKNVDNLAWSNAFKWADCSTGALNPVLLAQMTANFTAFLTPITTSTFRQCDRLSSICYDCENGAAAVAADSVGILVAAKLELQDNDIMDTNTRKITSTSFVLEGNVQTIIQTASLACRVNPTCYPCNASQTILGTLQGPRRITYKLTLSGGEIKPLIDRINTGARFTYYSAAEAGVKVLSVNTAAEYVPDSIIENTALTGVFCLPATTLTRVNGRPVYTHGPADFKKIRHYNNKELPHLLLSILLNDVSVEDRERLGVNL